MQKPWLVHYPPGIPATVNTNVFASMVELVDNAFNQFGERPALTHGQTTLSYSELDALSRRFASWLQYQTSLQPGERLAVMLPNLPQYLVVLLGAWRAGLVVVNVNPQYTVRELTHQLVDAGAVAIVTLDTNLALVAQVQSAVMLRHTVITTLGDWQSGAADDAPLGDGVVSLARVLALGLEQPVLAVPLTQDDLALLQYTGGTTGLSKGAMLTHGNLVANILQAAPWYGDSLVPGQESVLTVLPIYHIFALTFNCLLMLHFGAHNRLLSNPRDMAATMAAFQAGCSVVSGVNTLYNGLLNQPGFSDIDFSRLKFCACGGAAMQPAVAARWQQSTGVRLMEGYGLSETSPFALTNPITEPDGSRMLPMPSTEIAIQDDAGHELPYGTPGEVCIRGPQVMRGYWGRPEATAEVLSADGWFRSGDIGVMHPSGHVQITDRKKDLVLVSGFNVYPNEVEAMLAEHPGVVECAVVGIPDENTGEALRAFVVSRDATLAPDALIAHCRTGLTAYKVPKQVIFVPTLPKSPVGKILRRELRDS